MIHCIFDSKQLKNHTIDNITTYVTITIAGLKYEKRSYILPNLTHINFFPSEVRYSPGSHLGRDKAGPGSP